MCAVVSSTRCTKTKRVTINKKEKNIKNYTHTYIYNMDII